MKKSVKYEEIGIKRDIRSEMYIYELIINI